MPAALQRNLAAIAGFVFGAMLFFAVAILIGYREESNELSAQMQMLVTNSTNRVDEIDHTFTAVHALTGEPCSAVHLAGLRAITFRMPSVRDIAYIANGRIVCSGEAGVLSPASILPPRSFIITRSNRRLHRDVYLPFVPGLASNAIDDGRYLLLTQPMQYPAFFRNPDVRLSVVLRDLVSKAVWTISGPDQGLGAGELQNGRQYLFINHIMRVACPPVGITCFVADMNGLSFLRWLKFPLILTTLTGALLGAFIALWLRRMFLQAREIAPRLRRAIRNDQLSMTYHPIINTTDGTVFAAEGLIRWILPNGERVPPDIFIPVAERAGIITEVTCLVLRHVSRDLGTFLRENSSFKVSVNIAADDLADQRFNDALERYVLGSNISPTQIALELTERGSIAHEASIAELNRLASNGYPIYIDDFGTGHSNLSTLADLHTRKIKLDKRFTDAVGTDTLRSHMVQPILDIARGLGVIVIVEGVENEDQVRYFRARDVILMQGWYFAKPMSAKLLIEFVKRNRSCQADSKS